MLAIFRREVKSYFYSPIAYVIIGLFILLASFNFRFTLINRYAEFNNILSFLGIVMTFLVPILTMRIMAEDRKNGTEVLLVTSPVSLTGIVLGKFLAVFTVFLVMTGLTLIYPIILFIFGDPALPQLVGGYIGFILLGACYVSVGLFASSLTENQIIAAVVGFVSLLLMVFLRGAAENFGGMTGAILSWFSLISRYDDFNVGLLNLSSIIYYLSFSAVFIFLTIRVVEKRRWSRG